MPGLNSAIASINQNITTPPSYLTDARDQLGKTINGDYVGSNPYSGGIADLIAQKTGAQYNSTFGAAGRAHGGLAALLSSQGVGDALNSFYSNQYATDRGLQQQAIMAAPGFHQDQQGTDINALLAGVQGTSLLPGQVAGQYASGVTNATSPYVQNVTTQKQGMMGTIMPLLGMAAQVGGAAIGAPGMGGGMGLSGLLGGSASGIATAGGAPAGFGKWLG
jgi:hypothetical protein